MEPVDNRYRQAADRLLHAYAQGELGHGNPNPCALSLLLGGSYDWLTPIDPLKGTIDHRSKLQNPRAFGKGIRQIEAAGFTIQEILYLESWYAGRVQNRWGLWIATLDADTDPDGGLGLHNVLTGLHSWDRHQRGGQPLAKKAYLYRDIRQHNVPAEVSRS